MGAPENYANISDTEEEEIIFEDEQSTGVAEHTNMEDNDANTAENENQNQNNDAGNIAGTQETQEIS